MQRNVRASRASLPRGSRTARPGSVKANARSPGPLPPRDPCPALLPVGTCPPMGWTNMGGGDLGVFRHWYLVILGET